MNLKIRTLLFLVVLLEVMFLVLLEYLVIRLNHYEAELTTAEDDRFSLVAEADVLRQSSDDLTRSARTYVVTGDERYREHYFKILAIRNGEAPRPLDYGGIYWDLVEPVREQRHPDGNAIALKETMNALPYAAEEEGKLILAENNSNDLVNLEVEAFNAMEGRFRDDNGEYTIDREPDQAHAILLLHSPEYHQAKHKIMLPIDEFITMLDKRTQVNVGLAKNRVEEYLRYQHVATLLFIVFNIAVFFILSKRVTRPVRSITESIIRHRDEGQPLKLSHHINDEIGVMIGQFDSMSRELIDAREAADTANQAKSAFLANMSHELRTPMNAILGYSEMLIEEAEDLEQEDFIPDLKKINKAGTHLLALINDVLDLAKVESGKLEAFPEDIDIDSLIDEVSGTAHPLVEKNNNTLSIERNGQLGRAHQDLTKLRQCLFNLLSNAAKFTHDGTITLHVERTVEDRVDWLTLAVSDTGIGIPADKIEHVFEEFTQADDSTTRDYGGTGLGLAISRRFCQLLGGDLGAASEPGKGSTFTIRIPAILPGTKPQAPSAGTPAITGTELEALREAGPGTTILVIDDDPEACEIIERYLTKDGYTVATAASGEQGLRLAHEIRPAAITLDVMMPEMDGWSVLRSLKADTVLRTIPVIMLSMVDDRTRGYSLGAVDYLTKPVDREQLNKTLSRYYCAEDDTCPVLLVEDDPETREVMARTLVKAGWTVSEAGNGQEALDIMSGLHPRLILLDLMMPVMDGFDFLTVMRARPEWRHIPVIVITAKDLTADDRNRLTGRVEEIVEKSAYTHEQLLQHVSEAVAKCNISETETNAIRKDDE